MSMSMTSLIQITHRTVTSANISDSKQHTDKQHAASSAQQANRVLRVTGKQASARSKQTAWCRVQSADE